MNVVLSQKDLTNAIKLYLAYSGITRVIHDMEITRKLNGDDAGMTATLTLAEEELTEDQLADLAMSQKRARGLNIFNSKPAGASVQAPLPESKPADPKWTDWDDDTLAESDSTAPPVLSDTQDSPFAEAMATAVTPVIPEPTESTELVEGNVEPVQETVPEPVVEQVSQVIAQPEEMPEDSPFASLTTSSEEEQAAEAKLAAETPAPAPVAAPEPPNSAASIFG